MKMKVLKLNEETLVWIGVFKSFNTFFVLINCIVPIVVTVSFVCKKQSNNSLKMADLLFVVLQISGVLGNAGAILSLCAKLNKIKLLHNKLQQIVDEGKVI